MVNVVVVVEWWHPVVVRGFYSVVVLSVVSNQTRALSSPRDSTSHHVVVARVSKKHLPIETNLDHYESVEVVKARVPIHTPKISRARLTCLGNKALATRTASFTFF